MDRYLCTARAYGFHRSVFCYCYYLFIVRQIGYFVSFLGYGRYIQVYWIVCAFHFIFLVRRNEDLFVCCVHYEFQMLVLTAKSVYIDLGFARCFAECYFAVVVYCGYFFIARKTQLGAFSEVKLPYGVRILFVNFQIFTAGFVATLCCGERGR